MTQVRLYLRYGNYSRNNNGTNDKAESFGFDLRFYFGSVVEEIALQPIVRLVYNGALGKQHDNRRVQAVNAMNNAYNFTRTWETSAWDVKLLTALGLTANSDIVSLYFEPSLGLDVTQEGSATQKNVKEVYGLAYNVYAEIYITPLKNLEWYFEAEIGNVASYNSTTRTTSNTKGLGFNGTTGITWYLPAL